MSKEEDASKTKIFSLKAEEELRVEVDFGIKIQVKLLKGSAEIFGTEIVTEKEYTVTGEKFAVFTWHGCEIQLVGNFQHAYIAGETPMTTYLNTHLGLEKLRATAAMTGKKGPRVVVVGPADVGKSSLCKILLNYAVRSGRQPIFVDADVGQGDLTLPGAIGAVGLERVWDIEEELGDSAVLAYFFGHVSPDKNPKLYKKLISSLARTIELKMSRDDRVRSSGIVVNTFGSVEGSGYDTLVHLVKAFEANVILVIGHERVYADLMNDFGNPTSGISIIKLPKSGGVVARDATYRERSRNNKIKEYFYGTKGELFPHRITVNFNEAEVYELGQTHMAPSSALPIGEDRKVDETRCIKVTPSPDLDYAVLGVSQATKATDDDLAESNLLGFVCVLELELASNRMTVMSPSPGKLPSKFLLMGSIKQIFE